MVKGIDERVKEFESVSFLPWVGENYTNGIIGFDTETGTPILGTPEKQGKRVLILGDSHYCADPKQAIPALTINVINDFVYGETGHEPYKNTYTKFERFLKGGIIDQKERENLWNYLIFYNYVQEAMSKPREKPNKDQYGKSEVSFWEVLEANKPDVVIVWGKRLYNHLPQKGEIGKEIHIEGKKPVETWTYELDGRTINLLPIYHPSGGFSWKKYWHKVLVEFFKNLESV